MSIKNTFKVVEKAHSIKLLLHKQEDLSVTSQNICNKGRHSGCACKPDSQKKQRAIEHETLVSGALGLWPPNTCAHMYKHSHTKLHTLKQTHTYAHTTQDKGIHLKKMKLYLIGQRKL